MATIELDKTTTFPPQLAIRYNDNYRVEREDGVVHHMEHNATEAKALADHLSGRQGIEWRVFKIMPDAVRRARAIRPAPLRHPLREEAFEALGII